MIEGWVSMCTSTLAQRRSCKIGVAQKNLPVTTPTTPWSVKRVHPWSSNICRDCFGIVGGVTGLLVVSLG